MRKEKVVAVSKHVESAFPKQKYSEASRYFEKNTADNFRFSKTNCKRHCMKSLNKQHLQSFLIDCIVLYSIVLLLQCIQSTVHFIAVQ